MKERPLKLLFVTCVSDRCEIELILGLKQSGIDLHLVCDPRESRQSELRAAGIPVTELHIKHRFHLPSILALRKLLKDNSFDTAYATANKGLSCTLLASTGIPIKIVAYRGTMGHLSHWDPSSRFAHLHPRVSAIVCNCRAVQRYLLGLGLPEEKLPVVYKGHRPEWYTTNSKTDLTTLGIPKNAFVVGCIANIRPVKGVDVLAQAVSKLRDLKNLHTVVVGENRHKGLTELIQELDLEDRFHLLGYRSDVREILNSCNLSVMSSVEREGVPRAIIESRFLGVPVIVSEVGGLPEIVQNDVDGLVVPPKDAQALAYAIRELYADKSKRETFCALASQYTQELVDTNTYISKMKDVLRAGY